MEQLTNSQWIIIDSKVYDVSRFANLHPGGSNVLFTDTVGEFNCPTLLKIKHLCIIAVIAGKDATQIFFGLHRHEVLLRPQYSRLQIGTIQGQEEMIKPLKPGELTKVPYGEPTWLSSGYFSPYYSDNHRKFQKEVRKFFVTVVAPESVKCEESGKRISQEVVDKMRCVQASVLSKNC